MIDNSEIIKLMDANLIAFLNDEGVLEEFCDSIKNQFIRGHALHQQRPTTDPTIEHLYNNPHLQACAWTNPKSITEAFSWSSSPHSSVPWELLHNRYERKVLGMRSRDKRSSSNKLTLENLSKHKIRNEKVEDMVLRDVDKKIIQDTMEELQIPKMISIEQGLVYILRNFNEIKQPKETLRKDYKSYFLNIYFNLIQVHNEIKDK